jgi:hypothetical protein
MKSVNEILKMGGAADVLANDWKAAMVLLCFVVIAEEIP